MLSHFQINVGNARLLSSLVITTFLLVLVAGAFGIPEWVRAQASSANGLALTITPPLFQLSVGPGESWSSSITVVNSNPYDITVYARPLEFEAQGEEGHGLFSAISYDKDGNPSSLAGWITTYESPIVIPREQTKQIPFTVTIPEDASPGGHYAAILIGNQPPKTEDETAINVSSSIASLMFVNISGEVVEKARIREFSVDELLYQVPEALFTLRFENLGNVHLQPQGAITINNMWGKERGKIAINANSEFGNVLPGTIRKFSFTWKGDPSLYDIGRYQAEASLSFGNEGKQSVYQVTHFWVVPVVTVLKIATALILVLLFLVYVIRRYIQSALLLEAERLGVNIPAEGEEITEAQPETQQEAESPELSGPTTLPSRKPVTTMPAKSAEANATRIEPKKPSLELKTLIAPLKVGVSDARNIRSIAGPSDAPQPSERSREEVLAQAKANYQKHKASKQSLSLVGFMKRYALFFISIVVIIIFFVLAVTYFNDVLTGNRDFEITVEKSDGAQVPIEAHDTEVTPE